MGTVKRGNGFTLIEALITIAIFIIVAAGTLQLWRYTSIRTLDILTASEELENARVAMDAILMNIQLAEEITLETDALGTLKKLTLTELNPIKDTEDYFFIYNSGANPNASLYHRLIFGKVSSNELASRIADIKIIKSSSYLTVKITTDGEAALTLECSASIRNKIFNHIQA
jgi:type II secretory pathway pseudopilin PulG